MKEYLVMRLKDDMLQRLLKAMKRLMNIVSVHR